MTRVQQVAAFRALHVPGQPLIMPNPWDLGSAKLMIAAGAKAIATTSSGFAFTLGLPDGGLVGRERSLAHAAALTGLGVPVSGDFENGFGTSPETVAETVRMAAEAGLAGVSIEDIDLPGDQAYPFNLAVERIQAAVEAARAVDIVLCARADGWMTRAYDAAEAVRRCAAFAEAGAEVIYSPLVKADVVRELTAIGPAVNVLTAGPMLEHSVGDIAAMGAARISIGGSMARVTHQAILDATAALFGQGDLTPLKGAAKAPEIDAILGV